MADRKQWDFILKLYKRTNASKVDWRRTAEDGVFQASFPNYSVRILSRPSSDEPQLDYIVQVLDDDGTLVDEMADPDFVELIDPPESFHTMRDLYRMARRVAMGIDKALNSIMASLDKDPDDLPF